jgi:uncharacterized Zn-binding protein involved in type VI secretion
MGDPTAHGSPLAPGPASTNVMIGGQPAWLGMTAAGAAGIAAAVAAAMAAIAQAQAIATATAGSPAGPAAQANLVKTAVEQVAAVSTAMFGSGASTEACPMLTVVIPHGPGVVMNGSQTVLINNFPACRVGDLIQEVTIASSIASGCPTVIIGG